MVGPPSPRPPGWVGRASLAVGKVVLRCQAAGQLAGEEEFCHSSRAGRWARQAGCERIEASWHLQCRNSAFIYHSRITAVSPVPQIPAPARRVPHAMVKSRGAPGRDSIACTCAVSQGRALASLPRPLPSVRPVFKAFDTSPRAGPADCAAPPQRLRARAHRRPPPQRLRQVSESADNR
jgi:hypothetical protein